MACLVFIALNSAALFSSETALEPLPIANHIADKPQSNVWIYAGQHWAVLPDSKGTHVLRLDGTSWINYWRVIASNSAGNSIWSSERCFKRASPPKDYLIPFQASWKYLDNGTDQGEVWRTTSFKDDGWKTGIGKFGYGINDATTVVSYGPDNSNKYITTYFRKSISIADASSYSSYVINIKRDDGVVVYVNGTEIYRNNMPSGGIYYNTLASGVAGTDNGVTPISFEVPAAAFTSGTNVVAVEIHQNTVSSIDIAFDMELIGKPAPPVDNTVLSVATWNLYFFGADKDSSGKILGPVDDQQQFINVKTVLQLLNADIVALQEVANDNLMEKLVSELPGYNFVRSQAYSYSLRPNTNPPVVHKLYVIYKNDKVVVKKERSLFEELCKNLLSNQVVLPNYPGSSSSAAKNDDGFWDSGRLPYLIEVEATLNGIRRNIHIVNIHAIAQTTSTTGYERRKYDAQVLKDTLDRYFDKSNLLVLGDYNDDVDVSLLNNLASPYKPFVDDKRYRVLTYELSLTGVGTTGSGKEFRDHITSSGQLIDGYVESSIKIHSEMKDNIFNYSSTTSDHLPVSARFDLKAIGDNLESPSTRNALLRVSSTSTANKVEKDELNIYPNPTQGYVSLNIPDSAASRQNIKLNIWTMEGKLILEAVGGRDKVQKLLQEMVGTVPKGLYVLRVIAGSNTYKTKLVKN